jgi:hypothetical protein
MDGGAPESETESRSSSPDQTDKSGNGKGLGDLYPNGSSSALVGPVAARPLLRASSVRAEPQTVGSEVFRGLEDDDEEDAADAPQPLHEDRLPIFGDEFGEVDEGIAMDDHDADDAEDYTLESHNVINKVAAPTWNFDSLNRPYASQSQSYDDDHASNVAADGDDEDEDYNAAGGKMNEDFGYEEQQDGAFVHDDRRWTAQQVEESRRPSSPVGLVTAVAEQDEEEEIVPSVEVDMADASERAKHE